MKKFIILALVTILAAMLFVACDNDIKVDNNVSYTEILESDGAFVVNGKSYDSLQEAVDAAAGAKATAVKITVTKDLNSRGAVIPKNASIALDLDGHTITFTDVTYSALYVGEDANFFLENGYVTLFDNTENLIVVGSIGASEVAINNVCIEASEDQVAIAAEDTNVSVSDSLISNGVVSLKGSVFVASDSVISGTMSATEESSVSFDNDSWFDGTLTADASDVTLKAGSHYIGEYLEISGKHSDESPATLTLAAEDDSVDAADINSNITVSAGAKLVSNSTNVQGTIEVTGDGSTYEVNADNSDVALTIKNDAIVSVQDGAIVKVVEVDNTDWTIVCAPNTEAQIIDYADTDLYPSHFVNGFCYVEISSGKNYFSSLEEAIDFAVEHQNATVVYVLSHTSGTTLEVGKTVTIDLNGKTEGNYITIGANVILTVTDSATTTKGAIAGVVSGSGSIVVKDSKVTNAINGLTSVRTSNAVITGDIGGVETVEDGWETGDSIIAGCSTFNGDVTTTGAQTYNNSIFGSSDVDLNGTSITINNATGTVGSLRSTSGAISIDNGNATATLSTGKITAKSSTGSTYYDVTVKGNADYKVTVASIDYADDVKTSYASFTGTIGGTSDASVATVTDGWGTGDSKIDGYSTFNGDVTTTGAQTYNNSIFGSSDVDLNGTSITIKDATGTVGVVKTTVTDSTTSELITVTESEGKELTASLLYAKGYGSINVSSAGSLTIVGAEVAENAVGGIVTETGNINLSTSGNGTIEVSVEAEGTSSAAALAILTNGNINVVNNGSSGSSISLAGSDSEDNDYTYGVAIYAPSSEVVVNSTIQAGVVLYGDTEAVSAGSNVNLTNVLVSGVVDCVNLVSNGSRFVDTVLAVSVTDGTNSSTATGSTFEKGISATGILNFYGSTFGKETNLLALSGYVVQTSYVNETTVADVTVIKMVGVNFLTGTGPTSVRATGTTNGDFASNTMSIHIEDATGISGTITASDGNISIDNESYTSTSANFETGALSATGKVDVEGHTTSGTTGKLTIASVSNAGSIKSQKTIFEGPVSTSGTLDDGMLQTNTGSIFKGNVSSTGKATFDGSTFTATSETNTLTSGNVIVIKNATFTEVSGKIFNVTANGSDSTANVDGILIEKTTGKVGTINATADSIKIDNGNATATLSTGKITAKSTGSTYYDVTVKGNATYKVTVASIDYADDVKTSYASFTGTIGGTSSASVATVTDGGWESGLAGYSTFNGDVTTTGVQTYNNSIFGSSDVDLNGTSITINNATGTVGSLRSTSGAISINNGNATATLSTGKITAKSSTGSTYYDVTVKGNADYKVTVASIDYADDVKTSYASFTGTIGGTVATVTDGGWESGIAGCSTFNGNVTTTGAQTYNNSVFASSPILYSSNAGYITLTSCTGSVGPIVSKGTSTTSVGTVTINNSASTGTLYAGTVTSFYDVGSTGYQAGEKCGTISIISPNSTGKLIFGNTGEARFDYKIIGNITLQDGTSHNAGTLFLYGCGGAEVDGQDFNAYGGQYGDAGDSFMIQDNGNHTTTYIHGGTFYTNEEYALRFFSRRVHYNTSLPVEFKLGPSFAEIVLEDNLEIGKFDGSRVNYNKRITFSSSNGGERMISAYYYHTDTPEVTENYAVYVYAGTVTFNHVSLTNNYSDSFATLHYCGDDYGYYSFVDANIRRGKAVQDL